MKKQNDTDSAKSVIKHQLEKIYALRFLYIACLAVALIIGYLYNHYSQEVYEVNSTIGPVKDNKSALLSSNDLFGGLTSYTPKKNIEDEINSLTSFSLVSATVSSLNLEVGYFVETGSIFKQTYETYLTSPFLVSIDKSHNQPLNLDFNVTIISDSLFRLTANEKKAIIYNYIDNQIIIEEMPLKIDTICKFNKTIDSKYYKFSVSHNGDFFLHDFKTKDKYYFKFYHLDWLSRSYLSKLKIEPISFMASIIRVSFRGENIQKSLNFLNKYIDKFLETNLAKKNRISNSTINFIDSQISEISDSLVISESQLRNFKTANQVMDLSFQGQRIYEQLSQIETEQNNLELQRRYYNYVITYFRTNKDVSGVAPPMSANVTDPIMNQLISDLITLNSERSGISGTDKNLFLGQIENQIEQKKQTILENATNNLNTLNLTLNELAYRYEKLSKEISNLPKTELNMVNIERKFNLNETIYTYLLQKRSEAAITLASNYPDFEILEPARAITSSLVKPKTTKTYLLMFFLGLLLPTLYMFAKDLFNNNISGIYEVEHMLDRTALGVIYSNNHKYEAVVSRFPGSAVAESFRNLRSSLFNKIRTRETKIILTTSAQPDDGKTFVSFNLASSIASVGYKTLLIDGDLRKPSLHGKFEIENELGVSNYIVKKSSIKEIIHTTSIDNLYFIPAGPILPNPSELIDAGALDDLITNLKSEFEYILIDTSPIGLVADSVQLMKYANKVLIVVRNNYTRKDLLASAIENLETNDVDNYDIVINDIDLKKSPYSTYTNYYIKDKQN